MDTPKRSHKAKKKGAITFKPPVDPLPPPRLPSPPAPAPPPPPIEVAPESDARDPEEEERYRIWDLFAEEYHDIVVQLPLEYERAFRLLQELETTQQLAETQTKSTLESYLAGARKDATAEDEDGKEDKDSRGLLEQLVKATRTAVRTGEDKVGLAVALYESVDRHIRRLDADLARSEDSLLIGLRPGTLPSHDAPSASLKSPPGPTTSRGAIALGEMDAYDLDGDADSPKKETGKSKDGSARKRKREERRRKRKGKGKERAVELEEGETSVPEVPVDVDPTEPTYCYCDKVSYGEMIGCESDDCPREWFHLTCVGLDGAPEGTWYCKDCKASLGITDTTQKKKARKR